MSETFVLYYLFSVLHAVYFKRLTIPCIVTYDFLILHTIFHYFFTFNLNVLCLTLFWLTTTMALLDLTQKIIQVQNNKELTRLIFNDLSNTIDSIRHKKNYLKKLYFYGINSVSLKIIKIYLSGKSEQILQNNTLLDHVQTIYVVPQR